MNEIERLQNELNEIKVVLDNTCSEFRKLALEAVAKGLHIDEECEVHGDPYALRDNAELVKKITKLGQESKELTDQLSDVEYKLSVLRQVKEK